MSLVSNRDLEVVPSEGDAADGGLSTRPVRLTTPEVARPALTVQDVLGERTSIGAGPQERVRDAVQQGRSQTLLLVGELDATTAVMGRRQLRGALDLGRGTLVLDCSAVQFIDASWLGVLVGAFRYGRQLDRRVTVIAPSPRVLRVLRLVGLEWLMGDE